MMTRLNTLKRRAWAAQSLSLFIINKAKSLKFKNLQVFTNRITTQVYKLWIMIPISKQAKPRNMMSFSEMIM